MKILLIRHGESEADLLKVHEGRADYPLTLKGIEQAQLMANRVKAAYTIDKIWASRRIIHFTNSTSHLSK